MDLKIVCFVFVTLSLINYATSKPFLVNSITALLGASSTPDSNPLSKNIEIVQANPKPERLQQFPRNSGIDFVFPDDTTTSTTTEAQPNFIHKKLNKLLKKLLTISQLSTLLNNNHNNQEPTDHPNVAEFQRSNYNFDWQLDDFDSNNISNVFEFQWTDPKFDNKTAGVPVYGVPKVENVGQPLKIDLLNETTKEVSSSDEDLDNVTNLQSFPAQIGMYVLEIFASLVGLTVGAAGHISHVFSQNNTV